MTRVVPSPRGGSVPARRAGRAMQGAAGVILLCLVVGRVFVAELPFRTPLLDLYAAQAASTEGDSALLRADRGELARVTFACLLLADAALWLVGAALAGRLGIRGGKLLGLVVVFAVLGLVSGFLAADKRSAADTWLERLAMLVGGVLAVQCLGTWRGLARCGVVLTAVGLVLAAKGAYQLRVEIPEATAYLEAYGPPAGLGLAAEQAFAARARATTPTGFWGLSNPLGSLGVLCLMAAVALAVHVGRQAVQDRHAWRQHRTKGEIHAPTLAAVVACLMALAVAALLVRTRSRGGILAAAVAVVAWAFVMRWGKTLAAWWRQAVAVVVVLFLVGCAVVVGYGLTHDRLPSKTMTFRWHYWTATAAMVADHPFFGVGPGNFGPAYLQYRRAGAEEAVKLPHNAVAEVVSQFGIPAGAVYLVILAVVLIGMCRPKPTESLAAEVREGRGGTWPLVAGVMVAAGAARWLFSPVGGHPLLFLLDGVIPVVLLGGVTYGVAWMVDRIASAGFARTVRLALACGVAGFFLHGMVEFNLAMPGSATAFWVVAGACLGAAGRKRRDLSSLRWVLAGNAVVVVVAAVAIFWWPVYRRTALSEAAMTAYAGLRPAAAAKLAERAALADPLDGYAAADAARAVLAAGPGDPGVSTAAHLSLARGWAVEATQRDEAYYGHWTLAAEIAWLAAREDNYLYAWDRLPSGGEGTVAAAGPGGEAVALAAAAKARFLDGHYGEAVGLLRRAVAIDEASATLHGYLGDAAWLAGRKDQARAAWRRAAGLAPHGRLVDEALAAMVAAVARNPMDPRLRLEAAALYARAGRGEECSRQLAAAERLDAALRSESLMHFQLSEQRRLGLLRARAGVLTAATRPAGEL